MSAARALFAGPGAVRALSGGRGGRVEVVVGAGAYLRLGADWLLLGPPAVAPSPLSLSVAGLERLSPRPGSNVRLRDRELTVDGHPVRLERLRQWRAPALLPRRVATADAAAAAARGALALLPPPRAGLRPGLEALAGGRPGAAVRRLAGLGEGLTPTGDDVLAGYAAWRAAVGRPVRVSPLAARRAHPIGLAYLRCAERGEIAEGPARMLRAIRAGSPDEVEAAIGAVRAWGASSGPALVWGMAAAAGLRVPR